MIEPEPKKKLIDKVFLELLSCYCFAIVANLAFFGRISF
jgi:hypothetical protein